MWMPAYFSYLARAHADLGHFDDASRSIGEAMSVVQTTRETWYEAEIYRIAGEVALRRAEPDATKAEACFERALAVARAQQAKSWELRAAMSLARLLARSRAGGMRPAISRADLRLVHRRLRHASI